MYNLPFYPSTVKLIEDIKICNKKGGLKREIDRLSLQKFSITESCARQSLALAKMQNQPNLH